MAEVVWAFDKHMVAAQHAGRPVIGPNTEIVAGTSYIGPDQPAITVDPSLGSSPYRELLDRAWDRISPWDERSTNVDRAALAHVIGDVAAETVDNDEDRYQACLAHIATDGVVDLGQLLDVGVGDNRVRALAAGYLVANYLPGSQVRFDGNRVDGVDQFWVRYKSPEDFGSYLEPLATVVLNPGKRQAATLLETGVLAGQWRDQYQPASSPYARPRDEGNLALLNYNRRQFPVVRGIAEELGKLDYDGPRPAFSLLKGVAEFNRERATRA